MMIFLYKIFKERIYISIIISFFIIFIFKYFYNFEFKEVYEGRFWLMKLGWKNCADIVLVGDSRTCSGVSPLKMHSYLPDYRIFNFSFDGLGYSNEYLDHINKIIDLNNTKKSIILGISPRTLTQKTANDNFFTDSKRIKRYHSIYILAFFDRFLQICNPVSFTDLIFSKKNNKLFFEYSIYGWMGRCREPKENFDITIKGYQIFFTKHPASPEIISNIFNYVKKWTQTGINVYAFRPPTTDKMIDMENKYSGFNENEFVNNFESAGGVWINVKQSGYNTYDASHLCPDGASVFSKDLAKIINDKIN